MGQRRSVTTVWRNIPAALPPFLPNPSPAPRKGSKNRCRASGCETRRSTPFLTFPLPGGRDQIHSPFDPRTRIATPAQKRPAAPRPRRLRILLPALYPLLPSSHFTSHPLTQPTPTIFDRPFVPPQLPSTVYHLRFSRVTQSPSQRVTDPQSPPPSHCSLFTSHFSLLLHFP